MNGGTKITRRMGMVGFFAAVLWSGGIFASELPAEGWPIFRGDAAMRGLAEGELPEEPELLWMFETEGPIIQSSAVIGHGNAYIGSSDGSVYAIDVETGEAVWSFETEDAVEAPPTLHGGAVYAGSIDGFLYKLDAETGDLIWKYETEGKITAAANLVQHPEDEKVVVLIGSHDARLHGVDAETGERRWVYETDNFINGTTAVDERGRAVFGGCDGFVHMVSVADGTAVKQIEVGSYIGGSAAIDGGHAYVGDYDNKFTSIDLDAGEIDWRYQRRNFAYFSSPAVTEERVVFGGRDRQLHCVNRADGEQVWTFATRANVDSSPVIAGDRVVVGSDDGRLYIVNLSDGEEIWSYETGDGISSSPAVHDGIIIVGSEDGVVYAFGEERG